MENLYAQTNLPPRETPEKQSTLERFNGYENQEIAIDSQKYDFAFSYFKENQNNTAQEEMFQAVYYFEKDSLVQALNGDGNNYGFLEIIDEYSLSSSIASF